MADHNYWLILGPILIVGALGVWVVLTWWASKRQAREKPGEPVEPPPRGEVSGGIIRGTHSTESRWDEAVRRNHRPGREPPPGDERER